MKRSLLKFITVLCVLLGGSNAFAQYKPGQLDPTFKAPAITGTVLKTIEVPETRVTRSVENNGSTMIVGTFSKVGTKSFGGIAKLNANGSFEKTFGSDPSFTGISANDTIYDCAFYYNGTRDTTYLIVVGKFASFNGDKNAKNIAIIDEKGKIAVDMSKYKFDNTIYGIETYGNGQYYLYGKFGKPVINGVTSNTSYIIKLGNENSTAPFPALPIATYFQTKGASLNVNGPVYTVTSSHSGGYVFVGGRFSLPHRYIFRINDYSNSITVYDYFMQVTGVIPDSTVRKIYINNYSSSTELIISGDFKSWSDLYHKNTISAPSLVKSVLSTNGGIDAVFKPVITTGAVNSIAVDEYDSLLVTGPTAINGKSVGQLAEINITSGVTSTYFASGKGLSGGTVYDSRYKNGGFFLAGDFTQYDGTNVSKVIKINQTIKAATYYPYVSNVCEGDTLEIDGTDLGTATSVKWGTQNLAYRVVSNEVIKAYIPTGLVKGTALSFNDVLTITTLYPGTNTPSRFSIYKKPVAPSISTQVLRQSQTIKLGESGNTTRFNVTYDEKNYVLNSSFNNGYIYNGNGPDSLYIYYKGFWTGQDTAHFNSAYNDGFPGELNGCISKDVILPVKVILGNKPGLAITGKTKVAPGIIEQYNVVRTDTIASNADGNIKYDWYYIAKNKPTEFTQKYLYVPVGSTPSDTASAQFSFLSNTPEGYIVAVASYVEYGDGSITIAAFDTLKIPLKIATSIGSTTTCVDTLGCNSGYNINKVSLGDFVFDQKFYGIQCLGDGYSDFTVDTFSFANTHGNALNISMQRQTVYTSGRLHVKIESDVAQYYAVWIDINNDNDFEDPEEFRVATSKAGLVYDTSLIIPNYEHAVGERKIRLRSSSSVLTRPCTLKIDNNTPVEEGETEDYIIILAPYLSLQANQIITPNEDGNNEYLDIRGTDPTVSERLLIIYDRFGKKVYENANYSDADRWTGLDQSGKQLESGTYYFYFKNGDRSLKNFVEILRDRN